jgi:hypothetical protein
MDTAITLDAEIKVYPDDTPSLSLDVTGDGPANYFDFAGTVSASGGTSPFTFTAAGSLPAEVAEIEGSIAWTGEVNAGARTLEFDMGTSGTHKVYVIYGTPTGSAPTVKRIAWVTTAASACSNATEVCDGIHLALAGDPPEDGNQGTIVDDWRLLDGSPYVGECDEQARFMKRAVNVIGVAGGTAFNVYASTDSDPTDYETRSAADAGITWDLDGDGTTGEEQVGLKFDFAGGTGANINAFEGALDLVGEAGHVYAVWPSLKSTTRCGLLLEVRDTGAIQCYVYPKNGWVPVKDPDTNELVTAGYPACGP